MDAFLYVLPVFCAPELGDDHSGPRSQPGKKAYHEIHQLARGSAHTGQRLLAHKAADDDRVHRIIELLEKCPQDNGEKEDQKLFPDHAFDDLILVCSFHPALPPQKNGNSIYSTYREKKQVKRSGTVL